MQTTLRDLSKLLAAALGGACVLASVASNADFVAVVAEPALQPAMEEWAAMRRQQGHRVVFASPQQFPLRVPADARPGERSVLLLVGDGCTSGVPPASTPSSVIRTYGPEVDVASDAPHGQSVGADVVARLPFNEPEALAAYLRRVTQREVTPATWGDLRLQMAAGVGGFSPLIDAAIEQAATGLLNRLAPPEATMSLVRYGLEPARAAGSALAAPTRGGFWVWMGHGHRAALPGVADESLVDACGGADVAVLLACYTGDFAAAGRCVAERLLEADQGPLAVVAATRVTMPYGNTRLGAELLMGLRGERRAPLGGLFADARSRSLAASMPVELRGLDQLAALLGADLGLLDAERHEHAQAYHLLGDPLLSLNRVSPLAVGASERIVGEEPLAVRGVAPFAGRLRVEIARSASRGGGDAPLAVERLVEAGEPFTVTGPAPKNWRSGSRRLRVGIEGAGGLAVGVATVTRDGVGKKVAATAVSATR